MCLPWSPAAGAIDGAAAAVAAVAAAVACTTASGAASTAASGRASTEAGATGAAAPTAGAAALVSGSLQATVGVTAAPPAVGACLDASCACSVSSCQPSSSACSWRRLHSCSAVCRRSCCWVCPHHSCSARRPRRRCEHAAMLRAALSLSTESCCSAFACKWGCACSLMYVPSVVYAAVKPGSGDKRPKCDTFAALVGKCRGFGA